MKVEIWSDIRCPFCYIGKRKFELALEQFPEKEKVLVEWKSFELDPEMKTIPGKNVYDYLAERKGATREWSVKMHEHVIQMANEVGLHYDFDKAVIANSFDAHRLIQFAKTKGLGDAAEEALFKAYFTEGADISDHITLLAIAISIELDKIETEQVLQTNAYSDEVKQDEYMARQIGVNGVPFFVFNDKYAISGAQPSEHFLEALNQTWSDMSPSVSTSDEVCEVDGDKC